MDNLTPMPELSPKQYLLLLALLVLASSCNPLFSWLFPSLTGSVWITLLPPLIGLYQLLLLFRSLGVIHLPSAACYSALLAPLSALSFYQFVLH
ncbi:hypothetical protein [Rheinheimera baltica]|uniref:Uncharacterized protein n=1 Tax=Rheinheimera baltica TaxID=67576 RepID=A0ABT9HYC7_9GAMM|nr:hypothetical protein [Rheinheimera baltica]MDP5136136.1 hypothetical protein [Rheinheimera baltica]MDP5144461.1 hypothetical protein [Rheinheimera baltica]MDP5149065.1 hypothetical protein [Rheinheimera baltica]MDP5189693.1 hypothetical protein [Rheinheimera baltica]